jgi:hypothetical protein
MTPPSRELWSDGRWAGLLQEPALVLSLRRQAGREGKVFDLASLSGRVERVVAAHVASALSGGCLELGVSARRHQRAFESGRDAATPRRERPRSDNATEMVAVAARVLPAATAVSSVSVPAGHKSALRVEAYRALHREVHGCGPACVHADTVVRFTLTAPLIWAGPEHPAERPRRGHHVADVARAISDKVAGLTRSGMLEDVTGDPTRAPASFAPMFGACVSSLLVSRAVAAVARGDGKEDARQAADAEAAAFLREVQCALPVAPAAAEVADACVAARTRRTDPSKSRVVYDGRCLSGHLLPLPFSMGDVDEVARLLRPGDWVATADLKGGFHHVVMDAEASKSLGVAWNARHYRWRRLPFGTSQAPFVFCLLTAEVAFILRRRDARVLLAYVDDFIVAGATKAECDWALELLRQVWLTHVLAAANARATARLRQLMSAIACLRNWAPSVWLRTVVGHLGSQSLVTPGVRAVMGPRWALVWVTSQWSSLPAWIWRWRSGETRA